MRFLVVGAGAIGGYFGGRLVQKGEDVTFLVRPSKQRQLADHGLQVKSVHGDFHTPIRTITYGDQAEPFDCILLSVKAYHLSGLLSDLAPYVGEHTLILPLLNGYDHFNVLGNHFGREKVLGGLCYIESTLDEEGTIIQSSPFHRIVFGEWTGGVSERSQRLFSHLDGAGFTVVLSEDIQRVVWQKYVFISSFSGITTFMESPVGPILQTPEAMSVYSLLLKEIVTIARSAGMPVDPDLESTTLQTMISMQPSMMSSMQRDMQKRLPIEADHLHGFLLALAAPDQGDYPILQTVYARLKVYERNVFPPAEKE
ncbi:ketopantoate reductase family protein [Paenibacillus agri]|uniref:2-dehydropantoate 2-reductase n=1 Tax=Paenibacillus agri TaxID=2744309 RepID=A0A850ETP5_9BACL|nr:ketopantoate reductase family protein [Paenibacillus agri]NUU62714.1 ketopantoate reductase family protein [Paenibacillus agri]